MIIEILILFFVILLNGFFAASELAILSARRARLRQLADDKHKGALAAIELAEDSGKFLSSVQIGITLIGVFAGAYGGAKLSEPLGEYLKQFPLLAEHGDAIAFGIVIAIITYVSLLVGELIPKRIAVLKAEAIAIAVSRPMQIVAIVGAPFVWLLDTSSNLLMRLLRINVSDDRGVTEEEVKTLIAEGTESGVFDIAEKQMLEGVLRLGDRTARALMTPRPEVEWIDADLPPAAQLLRLRDAGYSRIPFGRGNLDNVIGVIHTRDILAAMIEGKTVDLPSMLHQPLTVLDGTPVLRLLDLFRSSRQHLALVVDEHGSVEGLVTATDILEAVAGGLPDQKSDEDNEIIQRDDGSYLIDAMMPVDEVMAALNLKNMKADGDPFHTLAGFVLKEIGHLPQTGEKFMWNDIAFEVLDMDGRRIDKVLVTKPVVATGDTQKDN